MSWLRRMFCTKAFDSDIEDPDLLASMREEPQEVQEEAHDGEEPWEPC